MTGLSDVVQAVRLRLRLSVRGLMLLVAGLALVLGLGQFWLANRDPERAMISRALRTLAEREEPLVARRAAIDAIKAARGRQARQALRLLAATLDDPNAVLRADAAGAIAAVGERIHADSPATSAGAVRPAVDSLLAAMGDPDPVVQRACLDAFGVLHRAGNAMLVPIVDPRVMLPALLTVVGAGHLTLGDGRGEADWENVRIAQNLAQWFMSVDPEAFDQCYQLASDCEEGRTRWGAILSLDIDSVRSSPQAATKGAFVSVPDEVPTRFLVGRLRSNPPGDRLVILLALLKMDLGHPIAAHHLEGIAAVSGDADPEVRRTVAVLLNCHRADAGAFLPRLVDAARSEVAASEELHATWAVLVIAPRSNAAAEVRSMLVADLGRSGDGGHRLRVGATLARHAYRALGILDPLLPELVRIADREVSEAALAPVACDLVFRIAPDSAEADALRLALQGALERPMHGNRRSLVKAALRAPGFPGPDAGPAMDPFDFVDY